MTQLPLILCESEPRWAPALRVASTRTTPPLDARLTIREVRDLAELGRAIQQWPNSLLGIEIERQSVGHILTEFPSLLAQFPLCRAVALLNRTQASVGADFESKLIAVLYEAGFLDVALSPRRLDGIVEICRRFAEEMTSADTKTTGKRSYCEQVRCALPWQPAVPPVG